jgi:outer membrane protein W
VVVSQYPVQLTAFLYIIPQGPIRPYILGGVGWYYTRVDYTGQFASTPNHTEHIFGEHLGAGGELFFSPRVSLDVDVRYIFLNPTTDKVIGRDFNYWQITAGLNFLF